VSAEFEAVIDKIEIITECGKSFGKKFLPMERELRSNPRFGSFRPTKHYLAVGDLRPYGFDAIMHVEQRRYGTHKLELLETGRKSVEQLAGTIEELVDGDPLSHRVSRIDLCVDVPGIPVSWFHEHVHVHRKQWLCHFSQQTVVNEQEMGKKCYQTLYWGKRPSCLRIYDKVAERLVAYERWKHRLIRDEKNAWLDEIALQKPEERAELLLPEVPDFLDWLAIELPITRCGGKKQTEFPGMEQPEQLSFPILTRVENQMGGRVPAALGSLHLVKKNARTFNPFAGIDVWNGRFRTPDFFEKTQDGKWKYSPMQFFAGVGIRAKWDEIGATAIWQMMNRDRNGLRFRELIKDFIPDDGQGVTPAELFDRYQDSLSRQLAA
jgi:hypothetical protein